MEVKELERIRRDEEDEENEKKKEMVRNRSRKMKGREHT